MTEQLPLDLDQEKKQLETEKLETRKLYLERLRQKLKDPAFRAIEGFPIAEDEAILALSDPPYYTACPNPFLPEIIEHWQAEQRAGHRTNDEGETADESLANRKSEIANRKSEIINRKSEIANRKSEIANRKSEIVNRKSYHREPFAADVSEGKNDPIYNAHSYHTKVPHKAIMRYILHYTEPGDLIFDGFCGTGMTGVAAQLCGDKKTVESLGYFVDDDGNIYDQPPPQETHRKSKIQNRKSVQPISRLGPRKAILCDLSPAATFIAYNYNTPVDVTAFEKEAKRILREVEEECGWMYETLHTDGKTKGVIEYTVWSTVFLCPGCGGEIIFWDVSDTEIDYTCPHCNASSNRTELEYSKTAFFDSFENNTVSKYKRIPVEISYKVGKKRYKKSPTKKDIDSLTQLEERVPVNWFPTELILFRGEKWGDTWRAGYHLGYNRVYDFYFKRVLEILSIIRQKALSYPREVQNRLWFLLTSVAFASTHLYKYRTAGGGQPAGNNLYIPALIKEQNVISAIQRKLVQIVNGEKSKRALPLNSAIVTTQSTTTFLNIGSNTIDYIFVDPPFGANIMYSESNFLWESWLEVFTNQSPEAIVNSTQSKNLNVYQQLMYECFAEMYRILKPGHWMTVEFHNSQNAVWNSIQEAILRAGFVVADVRTLDKQQSTFKQVTSSGAVKQDLVISAYKPRTEFEQQFLAEGGREKGAWEFVRQHLAQLPALVEKDGALEVVAERQAYLLYDRMVAFHIQRGFSVPLSAAEFYAGLKQRFPERDGMLFLPTQAAEYDKRRLQVQRVEQLALFVTDEKSTIQWLQRELDPDAGSGPQTYQDIQPKFLRELHQARHEKLPELRHILEENFLQDEQGRWFIPNPERQEHLEQLREKSLLREFQDYSAAGRGRLKLFRTEAVRAGFKRAWADKNYHLIVQVAQRLPDSVLQEDPGLLMYYDNALMRAEKGVGQERLL